jgi:glycine betaine/proline transport system ATP-binding protein
MVVVKFNHVDVIFGPDPSQALEMLDRGADSQEVFAKTRNVVAVHDATVEVAEGEICVLMGLSGSGKSSLLRCVNGLNKVTRGRVLVQHEGEDIDVASCSHSTLHRLRTERISMVFQQFGLMPWRNVRDNVAFGLEMAGVPKAERNRIVEEKLSLIRLSNWANSYPSQLSGGMQQRVGLARALATDADILLMDEPFSALDPLIRDHLQDELLQLQADLKKTILFVSHDLDEALKIGSNIAIMESGRIVQIGTPENIVANPVDDYVRQFVASVNPLNVLSCASLMRLVDELQLLEGDKRAVVLDTEGKCVCYLDADGRPQRITFAGDDLNVVHVQNDLNLKDLTPGAIVMALSKTSMKTVVKINHSTGLPVPVLDGDGRIIGVVGTAEIFRGILREDKSLPAADEYL